MSDDSDQETRSQIRLGRRLVIVGWILAMGLLTVVFQGWYERQYNPNQRLSVETTERGGEIVLRQNRYGHYVATGAINGMPVVFLLDTGATDVSVPGRVARELRLREGSPVRVQTANGQVVVRSTRLDRVSLGGIVLRDVAAHVNPHMDGDEVLLGMSFLRHLELVQRGRELTIRVP